MGFDDIEVARYLEVPLTTVAQPAREIGNRAGELLYEALNSSPSENPFPRVIMRPTLVIRESSGAARTGVVLPNLSRSLPCFAYKRRTFFEKDFFFS